MEYIKTILSALSKFVNLPANKQIIYIMASTIIVAFWLTIYFYKKNEKVHIELKQKVEQNEKLIENLQREKIAIKDSLYLVIFNLRLGTLAEKLDKSDSLLRESEKLKNSISPLIKKLNKKIENNN